MRKISFANDQIYHIFNRGTEKRKIFLAKKDYERFLMNLRLFNDLDSTQHHIGRLDLEHNKLNRISSKLLVDILCFCLMPNHYHLMLRQRIKDGVSKYLHKLQMGYSKYFNLRYERSGNLFQGAYKVVEVRKQNQFRYLPLYIHMNPLELLEGEWQERGVKNIGKAINFLTTYQWSSLKSYIEGSPTPYLDTKTISSLYSASEWREAIEDWLKPNVRHRVSDTASEIFYA